jgi:hypothetical protein
MADEPAPATVLSDAATEVSAATQAENPLEIAIQIKAYELFLARGERHGDDLADWLEAERVVRDQIAGSQVH